MANDRKPTDQEYRPMMGWLIAMGAGIGITLGLILDNYVLYMSLGIAFGVIIGAIVDAQNKAKIQGSHTPEPDKPARNERAGEN
jgi:hypothetical protein